MLVGDAGVGAGAAFLYSGHFSHCCIMCRKGLASAVLEACSLFPSGTSSQLLHGRGDLFAHRRCAAGQREAQGTEMLPAAPRAPP